MRYKILIVIALIIAFMCGITHAEQEWLPGYADKEGTLGKKAKSWRIIFVNTVAFEGLTGDDYETLLIAVDPTADNVLQLPNGSGVLITNNGSETLTNKTLISPIINTPTINHGTDTQMYVVNASGVMSPVSVSFAGDISGSMANTGIWNGQIVANSVTNTEIDNTDDYIVNALSITELTNASIVFVNSSDSLTEDNANFSWDDSNDELTVKNFDREAEMYAHEITVTLAAGGAWANVTGFTNGLVSSSGMVQNSTDGSITVENAGRYKSIISASIEDNDGPNEEYHMSMAVDGVEISKCEQHRSISIQAFLGSISLQCMLDLSADEVITILANSVGGDDLTIEHLNWMLIK